jgi:hypothetical protein
MEWNTAPRHVRDHSLSLLTTSLSTHVRHLHRSALPSCFKGIWKELQVPPRREEYSRSKEAEFHMEGSEAFVHGAMAQQDDKPDQVYTN